MNFRLFFPAQFGTGSQSNALAPAHIAHKSAPMKKELFSSFIIPPSVISAINPFLPPLSLYGSVHIRHLLPRQVYLKQDREMDLIHPTFPSVLPPFPISSKIHAPSLLLTCQPQKLVLLSFFEPVGGCWVAHTIPPTPTSTQAQHCKAKTWKRKNDILLDSFRTKSRERKWEKRSKEKKKRLRGKMPLVSPLLRRYFPGPARADSRSGWVGSGYGSWVETL